MQNENFIKLILTHEQADFDALASLLGAYLLEQDAYALLPRNINRNGLSFIKRYRAELGFSTLNELPKFPIKKITLVDTQSLITLKGLQQRTEIQIIDHHARKEGLNPNWNFELENTGACTTILVEKLQKKKFNLTPIQASLLLLGIYEDTGSLSYTTTTPRDLFAAAFLLENEANLKLLNTYLTPPLSNNQQMLYDRLIKNLESHNIQKQTILSAKADATDINDEISSVAHKMRDFLEPDALLLFVLTKQGIRFVARANSEAIDVSKIAISLGGGGHPKAASALIRSEDKLNTDEYNKLLDKTYDEVVSVLPKYVKSVATVKQIMSKNPLILSPKTPVHEVAKLMQKYGFEGYPVVENGKIVGLLNRREVDKAISHKMELFASSLMEAGTVYIYPDDNLDRLQKVMANSGWGQIPVVNPESGEILGIVTRTDFINQRSSKELIPNKDSIIEQLQIAIPPTRLELLKSIANEAFKKNIPIYIVGGFVRDLLIGFPSLDFDIVIEGDATHFVNTLVETFGGRAIIHGRFKTAKWYLAEDRDQIARNLDLHSPVKPNELPEHLDLISARTEFYEKPAALPKVEAGSIKMDLHRRDFTINTLALRLDGDYFGRIFDFWGGLEDLQNHKIRVLHALSFIDDSTRLMRAVRFEQRFNFSIEERTLALLIESLPLLSEVSGTRLCHELELILMEPKASAMISRLDELGILSAIHPRLTSSKELINKLNLLNDDLAPEGWNLPIKVDRLSLKQAIGFIYLLEPLSSKDLKSILTKFRLPSSFSNFMFQYKNLTASLDSFHCLQPSKIFNTLKDISVVVIYAIYLNNVENEIGDCLNAYVTNYAHVKPITTGKDLKKMGIPPSNKYGEILDTLREGWLDGNIKNPDEEKKLLLRIINQGLNS